MCLASGWRHAVLDFEEGTLRFRQVINNSVVFDFASVMCFLILRKSTCRASAYACSVRTFTVFYINTFYYFALYFCVVHSSRLGSAEHSGGRAICNEACRLWTDASRERQSRLLQEADWRTFASEMDGSWVFVRAEIHAEKRCVRNEYKCNCCCFAEL